jgi:anti-sigma regulatory factor (Ser/Thr protein kinase)
LAGERRTSSGSGGLSIAAAAQRPIEPFRHEVLLYDGEAAFLADAIPFIHAGLSADEPVIVMVDGAKTELLRAELGSAAGGVRFEDARAIGSNPARLIPALREFAEGRPADGKRVWGLGETIWPGRSEAELAECHRHEALVNIAFADVPALSLLCACDAGALAPAVVAAVECSHPTILEGGVRRPSEAFPGPETVVQQLADPLGPRGAPLEEFAFGGPDLAEIRRLVAGCARAAGLDAERGEDTVLAVNELATNSVRHGGGSGTLRIWQEAGALVCEVADGGHIEDPLVGRRRPRSVQVGGYGLWLTHQVCDLVQVRSGELGTTVRVHMRAPRRG